jgi:Zn-dependent protease
MLQWIDKDGNVWDVELDDHRLVLRSGPTVIERPSASWPSDIYVAEHDGGFVIRIETFAQSVVFQLSREAADGLVRRLHAQTTPQEIAPSSAERPSEAPLLWPKVSPLAVWALICSTFVFLPVVGVIPALATTILLILHRRRVRRSAAWRHSRAICTAAFVFLMAGLAVSMLAARGLMEHSFGATEFDRFGLVPNDLGRPAAIAEPRESPAVQRGQDSAFSESTNWWTRPRNWGLIMASLVVILLSLTVHEAAHATTAWWLGDDFARRLGRVTLNPLVHIDPVGTVLLPLFLSMIGAGAFGWARPVPVRLDYVERPHRAQILIALAGPGSNLIMAFASLALLLGIACLIDWLVPSATVEGFLGFDLETTVQASGFPLAFAFGGLCTILKLSFFVNVLLAFFNLIPVPPLDGSWVLEHMFPFTLGRVYERIRPFSLLLLVALIYSGALTYLMRPSLAVLLPGFLLLAECTGF